MSITFTIIWMIYMHILDDYVLQSAFLGTGKRLQWWKKNYPDTKYRYDYTVCLLMHGLSWAFSVMLPIAVYYHFQVGTKFAFMFGLTALVHASVDHWKANMGLINLILDQVIHMVQIAVLAIQFLYKGWV